MENNEKINFNSVAEIQKRIEFHRKSCIFYNIIVLLFITFICTFIFLKASISLNHIIIIISLLAFIFIIIYISFKTISSYNNDLLDYHDIESLLKIKEDIPYKHKTIKNGEQVILHDFRQEMWNNINRRGEKSKIALMNNIESKVKSWLEVIYKK